jgi:hypothetical protein
MCHSSGGWDSAAVSVGNRAAVRAGVVAAARKHESIAAARSRSAHSTSSGSLVRAQYRPPYDARAFLAGAVLVANGAGSAFAP